VPSLCKLRSAAGIAPKEEDRETREEETCVPEVDCSVNAWCSSDWTSHCESVWLDGTGSCPTLLCKLGRMQSQSAPLVVS